MNPAPSRSTSVDVRAEQSVTHEHILPPGGAAPEGAQPLATVLRDRAFLPGEALQMARQIADALACAHDAGVVHGNLDPHAVLVVPGPAPRVLVTGFGTDDAPEVPYVAPEQLRGEQADARADVFALGLLLFEMLEGRPLLAGASSEASALLLRDSEPILPRFSQIAPTGVPAVIARALRRPPKGRPTMALLRGEIEDCLRRLGELTIKTSLAKPAAKVVPAGARPRLVRVVDDTADEVDLDQGLLPEKPARESRPATPPAPHSAAAAWASTAFAPRVVVGTGTRRGVPVAALGAVVVLALGALGWPLWRSVGTETAAAPSVERQLPPAPAGPTAAPAPPAPVASNPTSGARPAAVAAPVVVASLPPPAPAAEKNVAPRIAARQPEGERVAALEGAAVEFGVRAADKNADDRLAYTWYLDGKKAGSGPRWKFVAPPAAVAATHTVAVEVADDTGLKAPRSTWTVEVGARMTAVDVRDWLGRLETAWQRKDLATLRLFRVITTEAQAEKIRGELPGLGSKVSFDNPSIQVHGRYAALSFDRTQTDWLGKSWTERDFYQLEKAATGFVGVKR